MSSGESRRRGYRIACVIGTRPEAIKMAPLVRELALRPGLRQQVILTGQHRGLADTIAPDGSVLLHELACRTSQGSAARFRESLHRRLAQHFAAEPADLVLVHGDTASALAGAFAAHACGIPIGHVEAGLRSFDLSQPWPEEGYRIAIDALSTLLFAPTAGAARNLEAEWRVKGHIVVTGNTGIDALLAARAQDPPLPLAIADGPHRTLLVTCHRKENMGPPTEAICTALKRLVRRYPLRIVLPLHPNPDVRGPIAATLAGVPRIALIEPPDHPGMVALMDRCWLILADSGGLQEEGPALGKPVLVLRAVTERPEAMETENIELVGTGARTIVEAVARLIAEPDRYRRMARPSFPFGDGRAAPRIARAVEAWLGSRGPEFSR